MTATARLTDSPDSAGTRNATESPRILALDLSLTCSGICNNGALSTLVPPKGRDRGIPRLQYIRESVLDYCVDDLDPHSPTVDLVVIEGYSFGSKGSAVFNIAELGGVIRVALTDYGVRWCEVSPASLKQFATGKGNANKELMLTEAVRKLGYAGSSNDQADALWLWHLARAHYTDGATNDAQRKALKAVAWPTLEKSHD